MNVFNIIYIRKEKLMRKREFKIHKKKIIMCSFSELELCILEYTVFNRNHLLYVRHSPNRLFSNDSAND